MKKLFFLVFIFSCCNSFAQDSLAYADLLKPVDEIKLSDSLQIDVTEKQIEKLDSMLVKKWFSPLLGSASNNRLKNRNYYLTAKLTSYDNFNLLVLMEEKKKSDSAGVQVVYLISTKKDGTYIASLQAAVSGTKKRSNYNTTSWLYSNNRIVLASKMTINQRSYDDMTSYRINMGGRFILNPKYE